MSGSVAHDPLQSTRQHIGTTTSKLPTVDPICGQMCRVLDVRGCYGHHNYTGLSPSKACRTRLDGLCQNGNSRPVVTELNRYVDFTTSVYPMNEHRDFQDASRRQARLEGHFLQATSDLTLPTISLRPKSRRRMRDNPDMFISPSVRTCIYTVILYTAYNHAPLLRVSSDSPCS